MKLSNSLKIFILFILITNANCLKAQLVNVEKVRKTQKDGFQGFVNFSLNLDQNVKQIFTFKNNVAVQYSKSSHTFLFLNDISLMSVSDKNQQENLINQHFQHFRYNYNFKNLNYITWEFLIQRQENKIKYLDYRFITGTGPRFRLFNNENFRLFVAPLFIYETELEKFTVADTRKTSLIKGNFYVNLLININDVVSFSNVTYYQPAFIDFMQYDDFERFIDFRLASESGFDFKILNDKLVFSFSFELTYDAYPPQLFITEQNKTEMLFYTIRNGIRYVF